MYSAQQAREDMNAVRNGKPISRMERWLNLIRDMANLSKDHTFIHIYADKHNPANLTEKEISTFESLGYKLEWNPDRHAYLVKW